jgi:hypothetical protein
MTPDRLSECLRLIRWERDVVAKALDVPSETVTGWLAGNEAIPRKVGAWLEALCFVHEAAEETKPSTAGEGIWQWSASGIHPGLLLQPPPQFEPFTCAPAKLVRERRRRCGVLPRVEGPCFARGRISSDSGRRTLCRIDEHLACQAALPLAVLSPLLARPFAVCRKPRHVPAIL